MGVLCKKLIDILKLIRIKGWVDHDINPGGLSDGEHKAFRVWGTQGQLLLMDMSLSDDKILERGTQGILALRYMFLSDDKILKRGTQLWV